MTGSAANLSVDLTAGPVSPSEDSHIHPIMLTCCPIMMEIKWSHKIKLTHQSLHYPRRLQTQNWKVGIAKLSIAFSQSESERHLSRW